MRRCSCCVFYERARLGRYLIKPPFLLCRLCQCFRPYSFFSGKTKLVISDGRIFSPLISHSGISCTYSINQSIILHLCNINCRIFLSFSVSECGRFTVTVAANEAREARQIKTNNVGTPSPPSHSPLMCSLLRIPNFSPCFMLHAHATTLSPSYGSSLMFIGVACRNGFIWLRKCLSPEMNEAVCRSDCSNWGERNRRQRKLSSAVRYLARSAAKWDEFAATLPVLNRRFSNAR